MNPVHIESGDFEDLIDSAPTEDDNYLNSATRSSSLVEGLHFDQNKYFIEMNFGTMTVADQNQVFPDYSGLDVEDDSGNPVTLGKPRKSKYKAGSNISLGAGWKWAEGSFFAVKLKYFTGKKEDEMTGTSIAGTGIVPVEFKDSFTSILFGNKWVFLENSHFKPTLGLYVGLSSAQSEMNLADQAKIKFESTGLEALAEGGFDWLFNENFGVGLVGGYNYVGQRTWKLKKKDEADKDIGFKSKMSYSNLYVAGGIRVYFQ